MEASPNRAQWTISGAVRVVGSADERGALLGLREGSEAAIPVLYQRKKQEVAQKKSAREAGEEEKKTEQPRSLAGWRGAYLSTVAMMTQRP